MHLKTLDIGMSSEEPSFEKTVVQPIPPLTCRVGDECRLTLITRTSDGTQLPHGGVRMTVSKADGSDIDTVCVDNMDGSYVCVFPPSWTSRQGEFDFSLGHDGEEFVPLRTLFDPTSGAETTVDAYGRLGCLVPPILCQQAHSSPNDAARHVCASRATTAENSKAAGTARTAVGAKSRSIKVLRAVPANLASNRAQVQPAYRVLRARSLEPQRTPVCNAT